MSDANVDTMTLPWFFHEVIAPEGGSIMLDAQEARHATGSRRRREGDAIVVFDGAGTVATGTIESIAGGGRRVSVHVTSVRTVASLTPAIHVAAALPKGDRTSTMLNMLAQLGVASVQPLLCARSDHEPGRGLQDRARRVFVEACKQCRTPHLPILADPATPADTCAAFAGRGQALIMVPGAPTLPSVVPADHADNVLILIGPEGDFTDEERTACCRHGAIACGLGPTILRIETAAVSAAAALRLELERRAHDGGAT